MGILRIILVLGLVAGLTVAADYYTGVGLIDKFSEYLTWKTSITQNIHKVSISY